MPVVAYRFGEYVLDGGTRQLLRGREEIHLSPKAFELLTLLIINRPRAMTKADLLEQLWPSTFVEETNLASLVAEIRRALNDSATEPTYLRTVYRFGYRFVGDVIERSSTGTRGGSRLSMPGPRPRIVFENRQTVLMDGANVIGRAQDATIQIEAPGVSRHHARIVLSKGVATLEDLGSKNGTFLQRKRITSAPLSDGDEIRLGKAYLMFKIDTPLGATDTVATDPGDRPS